MENTSQILGRKNLLAEGIHTVAHIRKNHAMEHATIHVLSGKHPRSAFGGYSLYNGFWIFGETDIQTMQDAVEIAQARLIHGEKNLAIHPNCGTNLAAAGLICAAGSLIAMTGADRREDRLSRFSLLTLAGIAGTYFGKPLGLKSQKYLTTDPDVKAIRILSITFHPRENKTPAFFIRTGLN